MDIIKRFNVDFVAYHFKYGEVYTPNIEGHEFLILKQESIFVASYEAKFCALFRYTTHICFTLQELICPFLMELRSNLHILAL